MNDEFKQFTLGTGACPNTFFYCRNEGHIGATIFSSRVNDGLCGAYYYLLPPMTFLILLAEKECCDGSDERPGLCPDRCKVIGDVYREQRKKEQKIQKTVIKFTAQLFKANLGFVGFQNSLHIHCFRSKGESAS
jgi:hypothetical protein